jgi:hypothetical protein
VEEQELRAKLLELFGPHRGHSKTDELIQLLETAYLFGGRKGLVATWGAIRQQHPELDLPALDELPPPGDPS